MSKKLVFGSAICMALIFLSSCSSKKNKSSKASSSLSVSMQLAISADSAQSLVDHSPSFLLDDPDEIDFSKTENRPAGVDIEALRVSVVPESYFVSIGSITTQSARPTDGGEQVYKCPGAMPADCLVEVSNPEAVKDLLKDVTLKIEREVAPEEVATRILTTVKSLSVSGCTPNSTKSVFKVKGKAQYLGHTWYTTSNGKALTTRAEDYGYVTLEEQTCSSPEWTLPKTIELKSGDNVRINLMVNFTDAMQFNLVKHENGQSMTIAGNKRMIHLSYISPVAYIGDSKDATVETYRLVSRDTEHGDYYNTDMNATMLMFIDPTSNEPLGATCRVHNDGVKIGWSHCPNPWSVSNNNDGTYGFSGSQKERGTENSVSLEFTKGFKRSNHTGSFETLDYGTAGKKQIWNYTATKI